MKRITLIISACLLLLVSCGNTEKDIIIVNSANKKFDLGILNGNIKNTKIRPINNVYSLCYGEVGLKIQDSIVRQNLIPTNYKLFTISKDGKVFSEILEHKYCDGEQYLKVFGNNIDFAPYSRGISCDHLVGLLPYSYGDLIFYIVRIIGKRNNKNYCLPITMMINTKTQQYSIIGYGIMVNTADGVSVQLYDDKYFCVLDFYMNSNEYIFKYYDTDGNYVGWTPDNSLVSIQTGKPYYYTNPLEITNNDWSFIYSNDKYGRPTSMSNSKERYEIKYTKIGYHLTGYDNNGKKIYEFEPAGQDFLDLRNWDLMFNRWGKLTKYQYDLYGTLYTISYYNNNQSYYLKERQGVGGDFCCVGIFKNTGGLMDDILIDVGMFTEMWTDTYPIYRIDPSTGIKQKIASLPQNKIKKFLLDYLSDLE